MKKILFCFLLLGAINLQAQGRVEFISSITIPKPLGWSGVPVLLIRAIADVRLELAQDTDLAEMENYLSTFQCMTNKNSNTSYEEWEDCLRLASIPYPVSIINRWKTLKLLEYNKQRATHLMRW